MSDFVLHPSIKKNHKYVQIKDVIHTDALPYEKLLRLQKGEKIDFVLTLPILQMYPGTPWLDYIHSGLFIPAIFLIGSAKLTAILAKFNIISHQIFDITIVRNDEKRIYHFMYFYENMNRFIDFNRSSFIIRPALYGSTHTLKFSSYEEMYDAYLSIHVPPDFPQFQYHELYIKENIEYDLFHIRFPVNLMIVSSRLKEAITSAKMTGLGFTTLEQPLINPAYQAGYYTV